MRKVLGLTFLLLAGCSTYEGIKDNEIEGKLKTFSSISVEEAYKNSKESFENVFEDFVSSYNQSREWKELSGLQIEIENNRATYLEIRRRNELREKLHEEGESVYHGKLSSALFVDWWKGKSRESQIKTDRLLENLINSYGRLKK